MLYDADENSLEVLLLGHKSKLHLSLRHFSFDLSLIVLVLLPHIKDQSSHGN